LSNKKKYVLFSPIGNHDPFGKTNTTITEGPMLHIIRHYRPEVVVLFFTREMNDKEIKDHRYTKSIKTLFPDCEVDILDEGKSIVDAHKFDEFITPYSGIFNKIKEKYPDYEILFNVTSGTVQMISALILEAQISNVKTKAIQVSTPERKSNGVDKYKEDDIEYIEEDIENSDNRCEEPNFNAFKRMKLKSQIISLINRYEYYATIELLEKEEDIYFSEDIINLLKHSHFRSIYNLEEAKKYASKITTQNKDLNKLVTLNNDKFVEYFYTIKRKQLRGELDDMILKITPFVANLLRQITEQNYKNLSELITIKNGYAKKEIEEIKRETLEEKDPELLKYLDKEFNTYNSNFVNGQTLSKILTYTISTMSFSTEKERNDLNCIVNLLNKLIKLEESVRNTVAHEMTSISEGLIIQKYNKGSKQVIIDISDLLCRIKKMANRKSYIYDDLNKKIIELL
jgi:CRISPR type III-A/MTUBE-associated protein Csm6